MENTTNTTERAVRVTAGSITLDGNLSIPVGARGIVLFAHGSGSSRHSPRNRAVARVLQQAGLATLLIDLLTPDEERADMRTGHIRFNIGLLAERLIGATTWLSTQLDTQRLRVGYFGASTGGGAAIVAASMRAEQGAEVEAVVSRGGRPDLAGDALGTVRAPTLLIVGGYDTEVIRLNEQAMRFMHPDTVKRLVIVPGATHLFEEAGTLEQVAELARDWFLRYLAPKSDPRESHA